MTTAVTGASGTVGRPPSRPPWRGAERLHLFPYPETAPAVAVLALLEDGHAGRASDLTGPARVSVREQVTAIAAAIGDEVRLEPVTREEALRLLTEQGGWAADHADDFR